MATVRQRHLTWKLEKRYEEICKELDIDGFEILPPEDAPDDQSVMIAWQGGYFTIVLEQNELSVR